MQLVICIYLTGLNSSTSIHAIMKMHTINDVKKSFNLLVQLIDHFRVLKNADEWLNILVLGIKC